MIQVTIYFQIQAQLHSHLAQFKLYRESPEKKKICPKNGYIDLKIKKIHKNKVDILKKLTIWHSQFYDFFAL